MCIYKYIHVILWFDDYGSISLINNSESRVPIHPPKKDNIYIYSYLYIYTLPETNIAPENRPSQKETSIPTMHFQGLC